jgi:hypothetical protein
MTKSFYTPCQISHCIVCGYQVLCCPLSVFTEVNIHVISISRREGGHGSSSSVSSEVQYFSMLLSESIMISCIWFRDSRRAQEISHSIDENCSTTTGWNSKLSTQDDLCSQLTKQTGKMPLSPYLTTVTQLHVTKITYFYDPTFHSIY